MSIITPAWPHPSGAEPRRAQMFAELSAGFEVLALWYTLDAPAQARLRDAIMTAAAEGAALAAERRAEAGAGPGDPGSRPVAGSRGPAGRRAGAGHGG